jgi:hypothetical protein
MWAALEDAGVALSHSSALTTAATFPIAEVA